MDARTLIPGAGAADLFFLGAAVDVTGWLGGCNFRRARATAAAAGRAIGDRV